MYTQITQHHQNPTTQTTTGTTMPTHPHTSPTNRWKQGPIPRPPGQDRTAAQRNVHDGQLIALIQCDPDTFGWALTLTHRNHRGQTQRFPTHTEQLDALQWLLPDTHKYIQLFDHERPDADMIVHWTQWDITP